MASIPTSVTKDAASAMQMLLETSKYSDLSIRCQDYVFKVHRSVVCTRSAPLAAAIDKPFKESITGEIDLDEDEPVIVDKLVEFLYTADFDADATEIKHASISKRKATSPPMDSPTPKRVDETPFRIPGRGLSEDKLSSKSSGDSQVLSPGKRESTPTTGVSEEYFPRPLITLAKVYIIADVRDVPALKDLAKAKYETLVVDNWNDPAFAESLRLLYENTRENDRAIKDIAVETARTNVKALLDRGEFRELFKDIGEVAFDVLHTSVEKGLGKEIPEKSTVKKLRCESCDDEVTCPYNNNNNNHQRSSHWKSKGFVRRVTWNCNVSGCGYKSSVITCGSCNSEELVPE